MKFTIQLLKLKILKWRNKMKFNVKWIINGNVDIESSSKDEAEKKIKSILENIINNNKNEFKNLGATAIQGSANSVK